MPSKTPGTSGLKAGPRQWLLLGLGLVVVGAVGFFVLRRSGVDFATYRAALGKFPLSAFAACLAGHFGVLLCSAFRVWLSLPLPRALSFPRLLEAVAGGQSANLLLPARAGDVMKAWLIGRASEQRVSALAAGGAVVADKAMDLLCVGLMATIAGVSVLPGLLPRTSPWVWGVLPAGAVISVAVFRRWGPARGGRLRQWLDAFRAGLDGLRRPQVLIPGVAFGVLAWIGEAYALTVLAHATGNDLSLLSGLVALCTLYLGVAVPVSFANLGTFEAALALGLRQAGLPLENALAIATVHHAGQLAATFGSWLFLAGALRLRRRRG